MCGCDPGCAWLSTPRNGVRKAPPDEAHRRNWFSLILYFRACAPSNVFRHGHGHVRAALTSPLGLLLGLGGSAPVRTCKLQSSVMAEILDAEGETLRAESSDKHLRNPQILYTQWWPLLHTRSPFSRGGMAKKRWADRSLKTRNCTTGREEIPSGNAGAVQFLDAPAWKRPLPTNLQTMKCSTGPPEREV